MNWQNKDAQECSKRCFVVAPRMIQQMSAVLRFNLITNSHDRNLKGLARKAVVCCPYWKTDWRNPYDYNSPEERATRSQALWAANDSPYQSSSAERTRTKAEESYVNPTHAQLHNLIANLVPSSTSPFAYRRLLASPTPHLNYQSHRTGHSL